MNEKTIAKDLLKIKAVFLRPDNPFIWASGIKSPIYCDNRLTLSYPEIRDDIEEAIAEIIRIHYPTCEAIMGTSTAGIAHAALVAQILKLPMGYVRSTAKDHGRTNKIEGLCNPGTKVVVVEDLISTGGSCIDVVNVLRDIKADVLGVASIFTYNLKVGIERLKEANVINHSVCDFDTLVEVAVETGYIKEEEKEKLLNFKDSQSLFKN